MKGKRGNAQRRKCWRKENCGESEYRIFGGMVREDTKSEASREGRKEDMR